jgi:hypothetical protein
MKMLIASLALAVALVGCTVGQRRHCAVCQLTGLGKLLGDPQPDASTTRPVLDPLTGKPWAEPILTNDAWKESPCK